VRVSLAGDGEQLTISFRFADWPLRAKMAAHIAGLGIGYLPLAWAAPHIAGGRLVRKQVEGTKSLTNVYLAWHPRQAGKALKWFLERLRDKAVQQYILGESGTYPSTEG